MSASPSDVKGDGSGAQSEVVKRFLKRLDGYLKRPGWNRSRLAQELGASRGTISEWWSQGRVPNGDALLRLPGILGVPAGELFGESANGEEGATQTNVAPVTEEERYVLLKLCADVASDLSALQVAIARGTNSERFQKLIDAIEYLRLTEGSEGGRGESGGAA